MPTYCAIHAKAQRIMPVLVDSLYLTLTLTTDVASHIPGIFTNQPEGRPSPSNLTDACWQAATVQGDSQRLDSQAAVTINGMTAK